MFFLFSKINPLFGIKKIKIHSFRIKFMSNFTHKSNSKCIIIIIIIIIILVPTEDNDNMKIWDTSIQQQRWIEVPMQ